MNKRASFYFVLGVGALASIGLASKFMTDPIAFLKNLVLLLVLGFGVFLLFRHFIGGRNPHRREQNAFRKAAKRTKKRYKQKDMRKPTGKAVNNVTSLRKFKTRPRSNVQLTVIEGRKGKRKKRASY